MIDDCTVRELWVALLHLRGRAAPEITVPVFRLISVLVEVSA